VEPWIDSPNGQLSLIDVSRFESKRDFRDWELENQDAIEFGKVSITMDETDVIETSHPKNVIETSEYEGLSIAELIALKEKIERELADRSESSIRNLIELHRQKDYEESSIRNLIELETESDRSESSIRNLIELETESDRSESSIRNLIELETESDSPESSIKNLIEPLGFNLYSKKKGEKTYQYWRYSYWDGVSVKHIHVGKQSRVNELRGKKRQEILSLLKGKF
jgi:hypothetical protein